MKVVDHEIFYLKIKKVFKIQDECFFYGNVYLAVEISSQCIHVLTDAVDDIYFKLSNDFLPPYNIYSIDGKDVIFPYFYQIWINKIAFYIILIYCNKFIKNHLIIHSFF